MVGMADVKVLLMLLQDRHGLTCRELCRLLPALSSRKIRRWVGEGRRIHDERGLTRLIGAMAEGEAAT